jgi:hypothetical protein
MRWILILIYLPSLATALPYSPTPIAGAAGANIYKADFIPGEQAIKQLGLGTEILAATPRLTIKDAQGHVVGYCSGATVSGDGTLLTAGHCIDECLKAAGALTQAQGLTVVDRPKLRSVPCYVGIGSTTTKAEILATNDCHGDSQDKASPGGGIKCDGLDFAVLKMDPSVTGSACLAVGDKLPAEGDKVVSVGFSEASSRFILKPGTRDQNGNSPDAKGSSVSLSQGNVIPFQDHCYRDPRGLVKHNFPTGDVALPAEIKTLLQRSGTAGTLIQTYDAEFLKGGSGGPLLDYNTGEIVGVASFMTDSNVVMQCKGDTFYSSTSSMLSFLKSSYPELDIKQTFNCRGKSPRAGSSAPAPAQAPLAPNASDSRAGSSR